MSFAITHGVLSPTSWALLSNSKIKEPIKKSVQYYETLHTIEDRDYIYVDLKYKPNACNEVIGAQPNPCNEPLPMGRREELLLKPLPPSKTKWIFCYDVDTGERIREFEIYQNNDRIKVIEVGDRLFNGFLRLDGKMSAKDERTGEVSTVILEMPKIKLSSSLSMRLGRDYENSTVSDFYFTGYPDENCRREEQKIARITFLDKELSGEYL